jgi:hypothetical protein
MINFVNMIITSVNNRVLYMGSIILILGARRKEIRNWPNKVREVGNPWPVEGHFPIGRREKRLCRLD